MAGHITDTAKQKLKRIMRRSPEVFAEFRKLIHQIDREPTQCGTELWEVIFFARTMTDLLIADHFDDQLLRVGVRVSLRTVSKADTIIPPLAYVVHLVGRTPRQPLDVTFTVIDVGTILR